MASSKANQKRTNKACNALKLLGISEKKVRLALKRLLKAYEYNWTYIEDENYRVLIDAVFEPEEPMVLDNKHLLRSDNEQPDFNFCDEPDEEDIKPLRKKPRTKKISPSQASSSVQCASEMQQMVEYGFGDVDILERHKPKVVDVYGRRVSKVQQDFNLFADSDEEEVEDGSQDRPSPEMHKNMDEDEIVTPCLSQIDVVSSSNGEVKLALSVCKPSHGFRIPSLDAVMKQVEEKYREKFQGLGVEFTLSEVLKEICECFVEQGNVSDGTNNQSLVQTFENFMEAEKQCGQLSLSNAPFDHTDAPVPIPRYVVSSPFVVDGVHSDVFNRTFRKQNTPEVDDFSDSTNLTLCLKDDSLQRGIQANLQVFMTAEGKGWGLRTLEDLPKGTFVAEPELFERSDQNTDEKHTYPVLLDEEAFCLDAASFGNVAHFINHRCEDANLVVIPVEMESPDHHYSHHAFFTARDVKAMEELTLDYGIDFDDDSHPVKAFYCKCGSRKCRQTKHEDGDSISVGQCCLQAPPDDLTSVLLLTRTNKPTFVLCRLDSGRKKLIWTEISYAKQLQKITGADGLFLSSLACCNKKLYALIDFDDFGECFIQVNIVDKGNKVLIKLLLLGQSPFPSSNICLDRTNFLKGSCAELFYITIGFLEGTLLGVHCFKLDMTSLGSEELERFKYFDMTGYDWGEVENYSDFDESLKMWEQMVDLKDAMFCVDLAGDCSVYYRPAIASEMRGNIFIRDRMGQIMYSYDVKNNTISLSSMPSLVLPTSHVSVWECRLEDGHGEAKCTIDSKPEEDQRVVRSVAHSEVKFNGWNLLNLPVDILETIMEHCLGVEYMNFRATCKHCHLAAPLINWTTKAAIRKLQTYSLVSPWLMVADKNQGIMSFTDPLLGNNYFTKTLESLKGDLVIHCSRFGWLLLEIMDYQGHYFFNPLTGDLRMLPDIYSSDRLTFSAPPTSCDCMVVGFSQRYGWNVFIHFVAREQSWRKITLDVGPYLVNSLTFLGPDLYALHDGGELIGFKGLGKEDNLWTLVEAKAPVSCCKSPAKYFLMNCDQDLLLVVVGEFGEGVEVFKRDDSKQEWVKVNGVGKHTIYICGVTCLCVEAKSVEMENKIYFPRLHSKSSKIVFYSLETCSYQTSNADNIQERLRDFIGTTYHLSPHLWIEPSWSS